MMAPHLNLWIVARGINIGLNTRMYFADEAEANATDPVLNLIEHAERRADADRRARGARRRGGLPLRHPPAGRRRDGVLRHLRGTMTKPCIICVAITGSLPRKAHNPAVPISVAEQVESRAGGDGGRRRDRALPRPQRRRDPDLGPREVRPPARGAARALPRHDRAVLHRRPLRGRARARRHAAAPARHGLADGRLEQLPDPGLRQQPRPGGLARRPRCGPTASSPRSRPSTSATSSRPRRWRRTAGCRRRSTCSSSWA